MENINCPKCGESRDPCRCQRSERVRVLRREIGSQFTRIDESHPGFDQNAFRAIKEWHERCEDGGLMLQGPPGVGKTRMAAWYGELMVQDGSSVEWLTEAHFFETVGAMGRPSEREDAEEKFAEWAQADWLVYDDLGSLQLTEARATRLLGLIDARYVAGLPAIWTTNRTAAELSSRIERFWISQGSSQNEARDDADKVLRRIFGVSASPLVTVIPCAIPGSTQAI